MPGDLIAAATDLRVGLYWDVAANADRYEIWRSLDGGAFVRVGVSTVAEFADWVPAGTSSAAYRVVADNALNNPSQPSNTVTVNIGTRERLR